MKNKKILINLIVTLIIFLIVFIFKWQYDSINITLKTATYLGVIVNIFCIISCYIIEKKMTSPYILFQVFSIPFLYGQLLCREILNFNVSEMSDLRVLVNNGDMIQACFLIMFCQLFLHFGLLICKINNKIANAKFENIDDEKIQLKTLKTLGWILIIISIMPTMYDFYINLISASKSGYFGLSNNITYGLSSIFDKIIPFFEIGMFSLMVGYKENIKKSRLILLFIIFFYGSQMFFGNRGIPLIAVITGIWLYHMAIKKINKKIVIMVLILIVPISSILNVIRQVRVKYGISQWISSIDELLIDNIKDNNPILETTYEMGTAIYPTAYTLKVIPEQTQFKYGKLYLLSAFSVVAINANSTKSSLAYNMNIAAQMSKHSGSPFGGSYIQEAYANFGWFCPIFLFILGIGFEILNRRITYNKSFINMVLIAYFLNPLLWVVRNVIVTLPREICWYILPTYILYRLIYNKNIKNNILQERENYVR